LKSRPDEKNGIAGPAKSPVTRAMAANPWQEPGAGGEHLDVFDFPTFLLGRLGGLIKRSLMPGYTEALGLTIPEWRVLAALAVTAPSSFNEVCGILTMDRGQVSRTLPALVAKSLVAQTRIRREAPRRRGEAEFQTKFAVTPRGQKLFQETLPVAQRHQMVLLGALDADERAALYRAFRKMLKAAEDYEASQSALPKPRGASVSRKARPDKPSTRAAARKSEFAETTTD
jgi:DNA-binding MarR family transcriptional regulator